MKIGNDNPAIVGLSFLFVAPPFTSPLHNQCIRPHRQSGFFVLFEFPAWAAMEMAEAEVAVVCKIPAT